MAILKTFVSFCLFLSCSAYIIDPNLKFSEMVDIIPVGQHFENRTVYHPFYIEIATGTLPLERFMAMTQQDDLYVKNFFEVFRILASRETDPALKRQLEIYGADNWDEYFQIYYDMFNFTAPTQFIPAVIEYSGAQILAAKYEDIAVALATTYPCYTVWAKMGKVINRISDLPANPNHIYKTFIEANAGEDDTLLREFVDFVDGYYARLGNNLVLKQKMLDAYVRSVEFEFKFAEANYVSVRESIPPPKFSDLVELIAPELQDQAIHHPLWTEIGLANLILEKYAVLIQQDHIYLYGFYEAFELMAAKETDPELKALLTKDPTSRYDWFDQQYEHYNFPPANHSEIYESEYRDHVVATAMHGTVGEDLASVYPCYFLWHYMGIYINEIANLIVNYDHPYKNFVEHQDPTGSTSMERMNNLINGYFDRLGPGISNVDQKLRMYQIVQKSINYEYLFANGIYEFGGMV